MAHLVTTVYSVCVFVSMLLVIVPFRWHLYTWNTGTCLYMVWIVIGCFLQFINSVVWANDAIIRAPIWCDISTHLQIGFAVAIPACSLAINRRLYKAVTVSTRMVGNNKRRDAMIDVAIGVGIPCVQMAVYIVAQGHRFDVFEELGCVSTLYVTWPTVFLVLIWPLAIGCSSAVYTVLILNTFMKRRMQFNHFIEANPSLTLSRYWRLMALASMEIVFTIPLAIYFIISDTQEGIRPWISWANVHFDFGQINQYPSIEWRLSAASVAVYEIERWSYVLCAVTFFAFFGLTTQARMNYKYAFNSFTLLAGRSSSTTKPKRRIFIDTDTTISNDQMASIHYMPKANSHSESNDCRSSLDKFATSNFVDIKRPCLAVVHQSREADLPSDMV